MSRIVDNYLEFVVLGRDDVVMYVRPKDKGNPHSFLWSGVFAHAGCAAVFVHPGYFASLKRAGRELRVLSPHEAKRVPRRKTCSVCRGELGGRCGQTD